MTFPQRRMAAPVVDALLIDTSPYLSCDECFDQLDVYVEKTLADPSHQDLAMQVHLRACAACAEEAETLTELLVENDE